MRNRSALGLRARLHVLAAVMAIAGCAAPAAQDSQVPSDSAAATPSVPASDTGTPSSAAPTPTATSDPTGSPAPSLAVEAHDDILPPGSIVVVSVDRLQLRTGPGLSASVQGTALRGERFSVAGWWGPETRDGLDWYRLGPATVGDLDAWAAAGSGEDRYLELVPPDCPSGTADLVTLINMSSDWDQLACFGDRSFSLEGTFCCGIDGALAGDFSPFWLTYPISGGFLWADLQAGVGPLVVRADPDSGVELPAVGSIVRVTGHFSDPASATCTISTFDGGRAVVVDPRTAELYCRERFVLDTVEVIGTDPSYTDPYNP